MKPPTYNKNVKVQEDVGPRLVKLALKQIPSELAPAAFMSGVLNKAKGLADKNTFIKGAIDGATGTTKLLRKMVTPPKGRKLTPNVTGTERISQGGALATRGTLPDKSGSGSTRCFRLPTHRTTWARPCKRTFPTP